MRFLVKLIKKFGTPIQYGHFECDLPSVDTTKPIPPLSDQYVNWPGKEEGEPKPKIVWLEGFAEQEKQMNGKEWYYFGCHNGEPGHCLYHEGTPMRKVNSGRLKSDLERFDALLCPPREEGPYVAVVSQLPGMGFSALGFWDFSVDIRAGSNSIVFAPLSAFPSSDALLTEAQRRFPQVFARLPQPVKLFVPKFEVPQAPDYSGCQIILRMEGKPYPRTCKLCDLGPCKAGYASYSGIAPPYSLE